MKSTISRYVVQVHTTSGSRGSGIIYLPKELTDKAYIFTAYHTINEQQKSDIWLEQISTTAGDFANYHLQNDEQHQIFFEDDAAVLVVPRVNIISLIGDLEPLPLLNQVFDFSTTLSIGYPNLNKNQFMQLRGEFGFFAESPDFIFNVNSHPSEDLETLKTEPIAAAKGMSGGGLFFDYAEEFYLFGILSKFKNTYKQFECISLLKFDALLVSEDYPALPFTYASSIGLNEKWFDTHIIKVREDLGDRYTNELPSLALPIGELFVGLRGGEDFEAKVREQYHTFIKGINENIRSINIPILEPIHNAIIKCRDLFHQQFEATDWQVRQVTKALIPIEELEKLRDQFEPVSNDLYKAVREEKNRRAKEKDKKDKYYPPPFNSERHHLRKLDEVVEEFLIFLTSPFFQLALHDAQQKPSLLITGKAGNGKSHLLGDIAAKDWARRIPSILILGNQLLSKDDPWTQILKILGLNTSKESFLQTLNAIGAHKSERILFMIDALNEGIGKRDYWINYLSGFIQDFSPYPFIGLVFSVRSTFIKKVVPESLKSNPAFVQFEHEGFKGMELEAVKHFANYFELNQPRIPLLSPEFSNPQFLLLLCRSLKAQGDKNFPEGLSGITTIYENYTKLINQRLINSGGYDVPESFNLVKDALLYYIIEFEKTGNNNCTCEIGIDIFSNYPRCNNGIKLYSDLIRENILSEELGYISKNGNVEETDVIRFTYERYGDHISVSAILDDCSDPKQLFEKGGYYNELHKKNKYLDSGILEALAIQLPERFGIELFEVINEAFAGEKREAIRQNQEVILVFIESLLWRTKESIDFEKCAKYINETVLYSRNSYWFWTAALTLAPIADHPFNSDSLHRVLIGQKMPERDGWWIAVINDEFATEDSPLSRLIDWILDYDEYQNLSHESIRLTSQLLIWCLTNPNRALRDASTIVLVRLLNTHIDILLILLKAFEKVDDLYILERLYAVTFGCITHSDNRKLQTELIHYVYRTIFKKGKPPVHLLLRDYARNIVEYGFSLQLDLKGIDLDKVRPPYNSKIPTRFPSKKIEEKYRKPYDAPDYDRWGDSAQNNIVSSVISWDFNKYTISRPLRDFYAISSTEETFFTTFKKALNRKNKKALLDLIESLETEAAFKERKNRLGEFLNDKETQEILKELEKINKTRLKGFIGKLSQKEQGVFKRKILPFLKVKMTMKTTSFKSIQPQPIARWILQRVFKLGWSKELHADFDRTNESTFRGKERGHYKYSGRIERIGKKYQWIAFFEILARVADNHLLLPEWTGEKFKNFNGPWERNFWVRDIDPTFLLYSSEKYTNAFKMPEVDYNLWHIENWLNRIDDIPSPSNLPEVEINGKKWIQFSISYNWEEPAPMGEQDYRYEKNIWCWMQSYFIKKQKLKETFEWMSKQRFLGDRMPSLASYNQMYDKEFYWSPHYQTTQEEAKKDNYYLWRQFMQSSHKGIVPIEEYNAGGGSYTLQQGISFYKPSYYLFKQMNLHYGKEIGEYLDADGNLIIKSIPSPNKTILVNKEALVEFLKKNNLVMVWTFCGEKLYRVGESIHRIVLNGAYYLSDTGDITGDFRGDDFEGDLHG